MYVQTAQTLLDELTRLLATGGPFALPNIALFFNDVQPTRSSDLDTFDITNKGGFTNIQAVVFGSGFLNADQAAECLGALVNWLTTSLDDLPATAYGYVLLNTGSTAILLGERFAQPVTFQVIGQNLGVIPRLVVDT